LSLGAAATAQSVAEQIDYTYDALGRLTQAAHSGTVNNGVTAGYSFDPAGNRSNVTVTTPVALPSLSISGGNAIEGNAITFTVTRSSGTGSSSVSYATADGTAHVNTDYYAASNTLSFAAGDTFKTFTVSTIDNAAVDGTRNFTVNLSNENGATVATRQATGTINDNDSAPPPPSFAITDAPAVTEGGMLTFTVNRTGTSTGSYTVQYVTSDGSAHAPGDYDAKPLTTLTFASGVMQQTIQVHTIDDTVVESLETLNVSLSSASGSATITRVTGTGTINDNDTAGPVTINLSGGGGANLRSLANSNGYAGQTGVTYNFVVPSGTTITGSPGIDTGSWPGGVTLTLNVAGTVQGSGGRGGDGGYGIYPTGARGSAGGNGGDAVTCGAPISISVSGALRGGGGGGGGAAGAFDGGGSATGGGGGGGGAPFGGGGAGGSGSQSGQNGETATASFPGQGGYSPLSGSGGPGGAGGGFGAAGASGGANQGQPAAAGGAAGYAVRVNGTGCTAGGNITGPVG